MKIKIISTLVFVLALLLPLGAAEAKSKSCSFKPAAIPSGIKKIDSKYKKATRPSSQGVSLGKRNTFRLTYHAWRSFGLGPKKAERRAKLNLKQIKFESNYQANHIDLVTDVNSGGNEAGGLFKIIPGTFDTWRVKGYPDRFSPLDNILAAVNAQINADKIYTNGSEDGLGARVVKILAGQGSWGPSGGTNPCK